MYEHKIDLTSACLPFSDKKQDALLGHLVLNDSFFAQAHARIEPDWFSDPYTSKIWGCSKRFFARHGRKPSEAELRGEFERLDEDGPTVKRLNSKLNMALIAIKDFGLDVLQDDMTLWVRTRLFRKGLDTAFAIYNGALAAPNRDTSAERADAAFVKLKEVAIDIEKASFIPEQLANFDDFATGAFFKNKELENQNALTFGNHLVDLKLNPSCPTGALLRGDHTVLLAPTNMGKTTCMISVLTANLWRKRSVLFLTHEGRADDIRTKILQSFLRLTYAELEVLSQTPLGQEKLRMAADYLHRHLVYMPINKPGLTVEEVSSAVLRQQERRKAIGMPGFDMIVCDYPAKLELASAGKQWARRQIEERIYNYMTQIALDLNVHLLSAVQTNREGSKINKNHKGSESRLLTLEDVAESFGTMHTATNVISLNRDPLAMERKRITYHICKSRSSETGWSIVSQTAFEQARTHGVDLKSTYYRGWSTLSDHIDTLLEQYADGGVPDTHILK